MTRTMLGRRDGDDGRQPRAGQGALEDDGVASGQEPGRQEAAAPPETVTDQEIP